MVRLRAETTELHRCVESELDLLDGRTSWLDYRLFLFRMYGFHLPVERALAATPRLATVIGDAALRNNKVPLLAHDLVALGVERRDLHQLPQIAVPALDDPSDALGWMYVVEHATLDNKTLLNHLAARLPLEIESASAYLACYGDEVAVRWREFGAALDSFAARGGDCDRVISSASECFCRLHRWLRPAVGAGTTSLLSA